MKSLVMDMGDLGKFKLVDDKDLGFSILKIGQKKKLCWLNSKGEKMLFEWLRKKHFTIVKCKNKGAI